MELLRQGSRNDQAKLLQRLLNKRRLATPPLKEDGVFGPRTQAAVRAFQAQQRLLVDGVAGPQVWQRLGIRYDITHPVRLFAQPTNVTCWSASATMILGNMSVGPGQAAIPGGGLDPSPGNVQAGNWLHAIVLSGFWSDGDADASGTLLRIHDPWPPGVGSVYARFYRGTVDGFDFISTYILQP
jgi:hypothetical protein